MPGVTGAVLVWCLGGAGAGGPPPRRLCAARPAASPRSPPRPHSSQSRRPRPPTRPLNPRAAYDFDDDKGAEEGDADLAKVEQLKALMGANWVDPPKRERKRVASYAENEFYRMAMQVGWGWAWCVATVGRACGHAGLPAPCLRVGAAGLHGPCPQAHPPAPHPARAPHLDRSASTARARPAPSCPRCPCCRQGLALPAVPRQACTPRLLLGRSTASSPSPSPPLARSLPRQPLTAPPSPFSAHARPPADTGLSVL